MRNNYKPLTTILKQIKETYATEGLDRPLRGSGRLEAGWHAVTIQSVDTTRLLDQGRFTIVFQDGDQTHKQSIFTTDKTKSSMSFYFRLLIEGLFETKENCEVYIDSLLTNTETAIQVLRGMKLSIDIAPGKGYVIDNNGGQYVAREATTGEILTKGYDTVLQTRQAAEAAGHSRSYNRITNVESTFSDENFAALQSAQEAISQAAGVPTLVLADLATN